MACRVFTTSPLCSESLRRALDIRREELPPWISRMRSLGLREGCVSVYSLVESRTRQPLAAIRRVG